MSLSNKKSKHARETIQRAYKELESAVSVQDACRFNETTIEDVRKACQLLENELGARGLLRNMGRLEPLLKGLECYGKVVDTLCQGTPFLPWIWAPIVAILKIGADCIHAFETLIKAYAQIGRSLARFENLRQTFKDDACFQEIVAVFYRDVVKFHTYAYKFLTVNGWRRFFRTTWGRFERQFNAILDSLDRHGELIDKEASARNIADTQRLLKQLESERKERLEKITSEQKTQTARCYQEIIARLQVNESDQNSIWEALIGAIPAGSESTCAWALKHDKLGSWLNATGKISSLWIQGTVGTGKSVLAADLVRFRSVNDHIVIRHFCNDLYESSTNYEQILKSVIRQLSGHSDDAIAYIHNVLMSDRKPLTISALEHMVEELVTIISGSRQDPKDVWIIIDGIDSCDTRDRARCVALLDAIAAADKKSETNVCKALFTSRQEPSQKENRRRSLIRLGEERSNIQNSIRLYTARRLQLPPTSDRLNQLGLTTDEVGELASEISNKAAGMFLYARLIVDYISKQLFHTSEELRQAVHELPPELKGFYRKIVSNITTHLNPASIESVKCVLQWIGFTTIPMRRLELLSAVTFTLRDESVDRLVPSFVVQDCFALLEERPDKTIAYIHATVKDFLLDADNPFSLDKNSAQSQLTLGTLNCLSAAAKAFSQCDLSHAAELLAVRGVFAFLNHATKLWANDLLSYMNKCQKEQSRDVMIDNAAARLAVGLRHCLAGSSTRTKERSTDINVTSGEASSSENFGTIMPFVKAALASQEGVAGKRSAEKDGSSVSDLESGDAVTEILHRYRKAVLWVIGQGSFLGVSKEDYELFKLQAQAVLFTCRVNSCPRSLLGFQTEAELLSHEMEHSKYYPCRVDGCQLPAFKSQQSLERHHRKNHEPNIARRRLRHVKRFDSIKIGSSSRQDTSKSNREKPSNYRSPRGREIAATEGMELDPVDTRGSSSNEWNSSSASRGKAILRELNALEHIASAPAEPKKQGQTLNASTARNDSEDASTHYPHITESNSTPRRRNVANSLEPFVLQYSYDNEHLVDLSPQFRYVPASPATDGDVGSDSGYYRNLDYSVTSSVISSPRDPGAPLTIEPRPATPEVNWEPDYDSPPFVPIPSILPESKMDSGYQKNMNYSATSSIMSSPHIPGGHRPPSPGDWLGPRSSSMYSPPPMHPPKLKSSEDFPATVPGFDSSLLDVREVGTDGGYIGARDYTAVSPSLPTTIPDNPMGAAHSVFTYYENKFMGTPAAHPPNHMNGILPPTSKDYQSSNQSTQKAKDGLPVPPTLSELDQRRGFVDGQWPWQKEQREGPTATLDQDSIYAHVLGRARAGIEGLNRVAGAQLMAAEAKESSFTHEETGSDKHNEVRITQLPQQQRIAAHSEMSQTGPGTPGPSQEMSMRQVEPSQESAGAMTAPARLPPVHREELNKLALRFYRSAPEAEKNLLRQQVRSRLNPEVFAEFSQPGRDPAMLAYFSQAYSMLGRQINQQATISVVADAQVEK
ncbi:hypothetical protein NLG97_g4559 [Lecanicillium saksenae]|uniref:Uncharacterized protein n=1 Tax=Lecanicillium saksenae TaxID=468837 RepID=A0ACC1QUX7_9HYPO|nr:hypothetical protein NLG97_g4559 [Lecanicillium saksenae]